MKPPMKMGEVVWGPLAAGRLLRRLRGGVFLALLLALLGGGLGSSDDLKAAEVVVIPIKGEISDALFFFMRRALKEAEAENASAVILDMDTYGGKLDSAIAMQRALAQSDQRTITYINPNSGSAGAMIAISTKEIYMAPISAIGAAAPVMQGGENLPQTIMEKTVSYYSAYFRSVAKENGHDPTIAEAFINKEMPVVIDGETVHEKGSLLTFSAQEASRKINGKPILAAGIASSIDDLMAQANLKGPVHHVVPTGFDQLAFWITKLAPLFLMGGMLGLWIEVKTPGFGVPGILSAICFTIFFTGHYVAGLSGLEAPLIFFLGVLLIIVELIFFPGVLVVAGTGALLMVGAIIWAMVDYYPGQSLPMLTDALVWPFLKLAIAVVITLLAGAILVRYLPRTRLYRSFVLGWEAPEGPAFVTEHNEFSGVEPGAKGVALSILRPSGRAEIEGTLRDVITTGGFVEAGTPIRVVAVEGSRIVVHPVEAGDGIVS